MCTHGLPSQCETTQNTAFHRGASLHGYTEIYGDVAGCQAELVHVPFADANLHPLPDGADPVRAVLTTDVLPTAWQGVVCAELEPGATVAVFGLGPIGQAAARIAAVTAGARVIGVDHVSERLAMAARHGVETIDRGRTSDVPGAIVERTDGRGADAVIDCVGMEADGSSIDSVLQATRVQPSRVIALRHAIDAVRRGGTLSVLGLYAGPIHGFPFEQVFDKSLTIRTGQVNVARWFDDVAGLAFAPDDPLALDDLVTHVVPMRVAPAAYQRFQRKRDGIVKLVFVPEEQAA